MSPLRRHLALFCLLMTLLMVVGCARRTTVPEPPSPPPVSEVVEVVPGVRSSITRAQVAGLRLEGEPLSLHPNIVAANWTEAVIDYPQIFLYNWEQQRSEVMDLDTGASLAQGMGLVDALRNQWNTITANEFGAFSRHRFGLALWDEHDYPIAQVTTFQRGQPLSDPQTIYGARWHGFVLTTAPGTPPLSVIGIRSDAGVGSFFRPYQGRFDALAWSRRGNYVAATTAGADATTSILVYGIGNRTPLFTTTTPDIRSLLAGVRDAQIVARSTFWTADEHILHFVATSPAQPDDGYILGIRRDGTGLAVIPDNPFEDPYVRSWEAALKAYRSIIEQRSLQLAAELPLSIVEGVTGSWIALRENAQELLQEPHLLELGGLFVVLDPKEPVIVPRELKVWHDTNHYQGQVLLFLDAEERRIAQYWLWEHDHYNAILQPVLLDLSAVLPTSGSGYMVSLSWNAKDGLEPLANGTRIPVRFGN